MAAGPAVPGAAAAREPEAVVRLILIRIVQAYRWLPPRTPRCSLSPGCSQRVLAGLLNRTMGVTDVVRCGACCPEHTGGWER